MSSASPLRLDGSARRKTSRLKSVPQGISFNDEAVAAVIAVSAEYGHAPPPFQILLLEEPVRAPAAFSMSTAEELPHFVMA